MSAHEKALEKKHKHKEGKDGKCTICNMVMTKDEDEDDEKGKRPKKEFGAKNNDSQED